MCGRECATFGCGFSLGRLSHSLSSSFFFLSPSPCLSLSLSHCLQSWWNAKNRWWSRALEGDLVQHEWSWTEVGWMLIDPVAICIFVVWLLWHWQIRYRWERSDATYLCMSHDTVVKEKQFYRLWTAPLSHDNATHLMGNICALFPTVYHLSEELNSWTMVAFLYIWNWIFSCLFQMGIASFRPQWSKQYVLGASGILFGMIGFQGRLLHERGSGMLELMQPFWTIIIIQLRVPHASFSGHLAGVLAGFVMYRPAFWLFRSNVVMFSVMAAFCAGGVMQWRKRPSTRETFAFLR